MRTRKLNIEKDKMSLSWFNSKGKVILKEAQEFNYENQDISDNLSIDLNASGEGRRIILNYKVDKPFTIWFDDQVFNNLPEGKNKVYFVLQEGDNIAQAIIRVTNGDIHFDYLNIKVTELSTKIEVKNFDENADAIINSLYQKLYTLKEELWYNVSFGMPLLEKTKSKVTIDSFILQTLNDEEGIKNIVSFDSKVKEGEYHCNMEIETIYGEVNLNL